MTFAVPRRAILIAFAGLLLAAADDPNPDASIWIEELRVGLFGRAGSVGGGRLRYKGEVHAFSIEGLTPAGAGVSRLRAQGEVFDLRRLADFAGTYRETRSTQPGDGDLEVHWLRNERGVRLRLRSTRGGAAFRVGAAGLVIALEG